MKDYYQILNINETSTKDEIKSSYRKLSKQFHPDVNPDGADKFKEIAEAYDVLSNDEKRQKYDLERKNPFGNMSNGFGDMFDIFNSFGGQQRKQQRAPDKVLNVNITPQESLLGIKKNVTYQRKEHCGICNGSGGDKVACTTCTGHGVIQQRFNLGGQTFVQNMTCPNCHGGGFKISNPCYNCNGNGFKVNLTTINLDIPKSVDNGDFLRVGGSGDYQSNIGYGDLVLQIRMVDDGLFQKIGNNLHTSIKLSIEDIFIKDDIHLEHPEGEIKIKFPDRIDTSRPVRIKTKGFLTQEGKGDFIIKFDLDTSKNVITDDKIEKIVKILKQR